MNIPFEEYFIRMDTEYFEYTKFDNSVYAGVCLSTWQEIWNSNVESFNNPTGIAISEFVNEN